jgi:hypothetical protein
MVGVEFTFCPRDSRAYDAQLPLYLNGDTSKPYLQLEVAGQGLHPRLGFDVRECVLPPVSGGGGGGGDDWVVMS